MFSGMGDSVEIDGNTITQRGLRAVRGLEANERKLVLDCWAELWAGTMASQRQLKTLAFEDRGDHLSWSVSAGNFPAGDQLFPGRMY